jgi:hypothetical protein
MHDFVCLKVETLTIYSKPRSDLLRLSYNFEPVDNFHLLSFSFLPLSLLSSLAILCISSSPWIFISYVVALLCPSLFLYPPLYTFRASLLECLLVAGYLSQLLATAPKVATGEGGDISPRTFKLILPLLVFRRVITIAIIALSISRCCITITFVQRGEKPETLTAQGCYGLPAFG